MVDKWDTPSVTLIGHQNVHNFPSISLHKREENVIAWIHRTLVTTFNQTDTLIATINKRETLMHIYFRMRYHLEMTTPINNGGYPNLVHIYFKKREQPMIEFPINKREHPQIII